MRKQLVMALVVLAIAVPSLAGCTHESNVAQDRDRTLGQNIDDATITTRIKTAYLFNPHLNSFRINVNTQDCVVTLQGVVKTGIQKDLAGEIAKNVRSVRQVRNELRVGSGPVKDPEEVDRTFSQAVMDATTTASVKTALAFTRGVKASDINVSTRWGTVKLEGEVAARSEKERAERAARMTEGVKEVENLLKVRG